MNHLTPEQFVDLAEGTAPDTSMPHLASCKACRRELADLRAMLSAVEGPEDPGEVVASEPSPLFWEHLSARVREAVAEEAARPPSWRERVLRPLVLVPSLAGALGVALLAALLVNVRGEKTPPTIPSAPLAAGGVTLPALSPSLAPLAPLGSADDPQLGLVAASGTTLDWDEMREEMAVAVPGGSTDVVVGALTPDEQRELQRLLAEEMAQSSALEHRS